MQHIKNDVYFKYLIHLKDTPWVSQHQKGKTILDFSEAGDDEVAVASAGPYANHLHLTPDR